MGSMLEEKWLQLPPTMLLPRGKLLLLLSENGRTENKSLCTYEAFFPSNRGLHEWKPYSSSSIGGGSSQQQLA